MGMRLYFNWNTIYNADMNELGDIAVQKIRKNHTFRGEKCLKFSLGK